MALETKVYKLNDIMSRFSTEEDVTRLALAVVRTVHPESWTVMGGNGAVAAVQLAGPSQDTPGVWRLVVLSEHQTAVRQLLDDLE